MRSWQYAKYLARHKWYVFVAGRALSVSLWRLVVHDWSKLGWIEWRAYKNAFHAPERTAKIDAAFDRAWLHHIHKNPHHWNHWTFPGSVSLDVGSKPKVMPMPEHFVREMIADWLGAGRAQKSKWGASEWYAENEEKIVLHPETRAYVEYLLDWWDHR